MRGINGGPQPPCQTAMRSSSLGCRGIIGESFLQRLVFLCQFDIPLCSCCQKVFAIHPTARTTIQLSIPPNLPLHSRNQLRYILPLPFKVIHRFLPLSLLPQILPISISPSLPPSSSPSPSLLLFLPSSNNSLIPPVPLNLG
jgi:hypothetical protein